MSARCSSLLALVGVALVSMAATCEGPRPIDLDIQDRGRPTPSGRVAYEFLPGNDTRRRGSLLDVVTRSAPFEGVAPETELPEVAFTFGVVGEVAVTNGHGSEPVPAGREVEFDGTLAGPATAGVAVDNVRGFAAARPGIRLRDMFSVEALLGIGVDRTRVRVQSPGGFFQTSEETRPGALFGLRLTFRPVPLLDLYAQGATTVGEAITTDLEAGGQLNLTRNVGLYAGYRRFKFAEEKGRGSPSDLEFDFAGPTFGLSLTF